MKVIVSIVFAVIGSHGGSFHETDSRGAASDGIVNCDASPASF